MEKVGFLGEYDKTDLIIYVAKVLTELGKKVLILDTTQRQKTRYVVPTINPTISYIIDFEDMDVAVGFQKFEEVQAYCRERNNNVDAERFIDYYTANGWQVGKNKMKDWKAAVRNWERSNYNKTIAHQEKQGTGNIFVDMMIEKGMVEKGDLNT